MGYQKPCTAPISDDFAAHQARNSVEPGTDYACAYGTAIKAAESGIVSLADSGNGGGDGRRVSIDLDDGRRVSYIHLSRVDVGGGQRVTRGQRVGLSGASGFGDDWYYGPHVHVSLWKRPGLAFSDTIDFQPHVGAPSNAKPDPDDLPKPGVMLTWRWIGVQRMLKRFYGYQGAIDNKPGHGTISALQRFLNAKGYRRLKVDGEFGPETCKGVQQWLKLRWGYLGAIDAIPGTKTKASWIRADAANDAAFK